MAISQSNYIPWKGYFDLIDSVDTFVILDDVQYTRRDWRNRNQIKTPDGLLWLTIPVQTRGKFNANIREVEVTDAEWATRHWKSITHHYARAAHFDAVAPALRSLYDRALQLRTLSEINRLFLSGIADMLGITTVLADSNEFVLVEGKNERLLSICAELGASTYVTGPRAMAYLDESMFTSAGIQVEAFDYSGYPEYRQLYPPFEHAVSIVDLLLNEGKDAVSFMKKGLR